MFPPSNTHSNHNVFKHTLCLHNLLIVTPVHSHTTVINMHVLFLREIVAMWCIWNVWNVDVFNQSACTILLASNQRIAIATSSRFETLTFGTSNLSSFWPRFEYVVCVVCCLRILCLFWSCYRRKSYRKFVRSCVVTVGCFGYAFF